MNNILIVIRSLVGFGPSPQRDPTSFPRLQGSENAYFLSMILIFELIILIFKLSKPQK